MSAPRPLVAIVGNPNTGKTTLFNRLTGQNARVGNYPGVTVERRVGVCKLPGAEGVREVDLLDVPGTYSLNARSSEEQIAIQATLGDDDNPAPDLVVVVLDATQLVRNLYLVLQLLELGAPLLLALNFLDEAGKDPPDTRSLAATFGVPCVGLCARDGQGVPQLRQAIAAGLASPPRRVLTLPYPPAVEAAVSAVSPSLDTAVQRGERRGLALWALLSIDEQDELVDVPDVVRTSCLQARRPEVDLDALVITTRYAWLDDAAKGFYRPPPPRNTTERLDRVLLHPVSGFALFLLIMGALFQTLFSGADPMIGLVEDLFGFLGGQIEAALPAGLLRDLLVEGLIGGVGNVIVFLPQILLLFFFIGLLEDSGYMARVAYLMDRIMRGLGLHGRAFVPMISGFACAVPAIMATRTMERKRDRLLTMMVVPLMTCSARLPVYTLIIGALFPPDKLLGVLPIQGLLMVGMYLFSTVVALVAAGVLGRTAIKGPRVPLLLELPPYRMPAIGGVLRMMWERSRLFLTEAGTVILACTVVLWALLAFPQGAPPPPDSAPEVVAEAEATQLAQSYAGQLGHAIEPAIAPLGFDWKIGVGLIGAFAAREVFVSTMGLVYGTGGDIDENDLSLRERIRAETRENGRPVYTPLTGLSLMVFFALACQCMSTLAVVKRETRGYRWPVFLFVYMSALAWVCSFVVYQGGRLLGLG